MKRSKKSVVSLLVVLFLVSVTLVPNSTFASDELGTLKVNNVTFIIEEEALGKIEQEALEESLRAIEKDNPNAGTIRVHNVYSLKNTDQDFLNSESELQPASILYDYSTVKSHQGNYNGPANFIISVARGQTKSLTTTSEFKYTSQVTASGGISLPTGVKGDVESTLTAEIKRTYSTTVTWTGPDSPYISRNFYITFFANHGTFTTTRTNKITGNSDTFRGDYRDPTHYVEWSQDIN